MKKSNTPILLIPLFEVFIRKYPVQKGRTQNRKAISTSMISSYRSVLIKLREYESRTGKALYIPVMSGNSAKEIRRVNHRWQQMYASVSKYLYSKGHVDNYAGFVFRILRTFFNWVSREYNLNLGNFRDFIHVVKDDIPIVALDVYQLRKLNDPSFLGSLPALMQKIADLTLFGCCVGLRYSDLAHLTARSLEKHGANTYLTHISNKTDVWTRIKLPPLAVNLIEKYKSRSKQLLPYPSKNHFNNSLKKLGELAGWTQEVGKIRYRNRVRVELKRNNGRKYRFCDLLSSHMMRKTTITTFLMNGMPEHMVRKISGHSANSPSFFRYVKYSQPYVDEETDRVFKMLGL